MVGKDVVDGSGVQRAEVTLNSRDGSVRGGEDSDTTDGLERGNEIGRGEEAGEDGDGLGGDGREVARDGEDFVDDVDLKVAVGGGVAEGTCDDGKAVSIR